jgi:hypothetical protein
MSNTIARGLGVREGSPASEPQQPSYHRFSAGHFVSGRARVQKVAVRHRFAPAVDATGLRSKDEGGYLAMETGHQRESVLWRKISEVI